MNLFSIIMVALCLSCSSSKLPQAEYQQLVVKPLSLTDALSSSRSLRSNAKVIKVSKISKAEYKKLAESYCRQRYEKRYSGVKLESDKRFRCLYKRTAQEIRIQAERECQQKHGDMYRYVELRGNTYRCVFKKSKDELIREAERLCKKQLGRKFSGVSFPLAKEGTYSRLICEYKN